MKVGDEVSFSEAMRLLAQGYHAVALRDPCDRYQVTALPVVEATRMKTPDQPALVATLTGEPSVISSIAAELSVLRELKAEVEGDNGLRLKAEAGWALANARLKLLDERAADLAAAKLEITRLHGEACDLALTAIDLALTAIDLDNALIEARLEIEQLKGVK